MSDLRMGQIIEKLDETVTDLSKVDLFALQNIATLAQIKSPSTPALLISGAIRTLFSQIPALQDELHTSKEETLQEIEAGINDLIIHLISAKHNLKSISGGKAR